MINDKLLLHGYSSQFVKLVGLSFIICHLFVFPCEAQTKKANTVRQDLSQARTILKSGRGGDQAERLMTDLLKDSVNREDKRIYAVWYDAVLMQYLAVNEKLYMKQRQDTAQFLELTRRLFNVAMTLDSLDMRPDKKGRVAPEYRRDHARQLSTYRPNLFAAVTYFVRKGDYAKAYDYGETYIGTARQPLFSDLRLDSTDSRMPEVAYWTTYSGYRQQDAVRTLRYRKLALRDTSKTEFTLQYIAEARRWLKDDSLYVETLRQGFRDYPRNPYFFPRLMDYYTSHKDYHRALRVVNCALEANDSSQLTLFAKATVLFDLGHFDESIKVSEKLIERNDTMPEPYYNIGSCYMNKALALSPLREKKQQRRLYQQARQYMERYRQLAPDEKQKWGPALYRIYLNLNMGRQFDEIDRLLNQ
jgi:tetratricopeptide (TPR) repeat protein